MSERQVLRAIQNEGPLSRAALARHTGLSAPTASKAIESLLRAGLLEEDAPGGGRGRPAKRLRMASARAQVLGLVIDAGRCRVVSAGLDGTLHEERSTSFPTPETYDALLDEAARHLKLLRDSGPAATLGLGVSLPGLVDYRNERSVLSPNVGITNGHSPARDLADRLGLEAVVVQEEHALCLAERYYGGARGVDHFAVLDVSTGVGLGVMSGGRLVTGHCGFAGEIGHLTMELDGRLCGCGNYGCLETVASDSAFAWALSRRVGREMGIDEAVEAVGAGELDASWELARVGRYLGVAVAGVINLFNPAALFIHGRLLALDHGFLPRVMEEVRRRSLGPSVAECRITPAAGSKPHGAVAAIVDHLTNSVLPGAERETVETAP